MGCEGSLGKWAASIAVFSAMTLAMTSIAYAQSSPQCNAFDPDVCDVETFNAASQGWYDQSMQPWLSPNGFEFEVISGGGWLLVDDWTNLGQGLFFECDTMLMTLPDRREYVTLVYKGFPATVNFVAVDGSNNIVDEATKENLNPGVGAEVVTLGTGSALIDAVYMHHVYSATDCDYDCQEPMISEVRACDTSP